MSKYTLVVTDTGNNIGDLSVESLSLGVLQGSGPKGAGWTGVSYSTVTRKFTFTSNDGLGYVSDDISVGMEADTLDGQHGSYYTGYTDSQIPAVVTQTFVNNLNVDADTLDGQHGSYYTGYTDTAIANLIDTAPATLDTLNELAAALGDDPNFATTIATSVGTKVSKSGDTMTGDLTVPNLVTAGLVDGRDVSVDGAKLDSIESGATADQTITAGSGLTGGGTGDVTISHADTSTQASVNNSGRTYIQDITLDDFGHITAIVSATDADDYVGTVTSVAATVPTGLTVSGSPITSAGTLAFSYTAGYQGYTTAEASKLAGIEAGATADMTAAEILTAIKTVDGSGSGLDADTLDGLNSTDFDPAGTALALAIALG